LKVECGGSRKHESLNPDACFFIVDRYFAVDHNNQDVYIVVVAKDNPQDQHDSIEWLNLMSTRLQSLKGATNTFSNSLQHEVQMGAFSERENKTEYMQNITKCLEVRL